MATIKKIGTIFLFALTLGLGLEIAAPSSSFADPPPWAPAHGYKGYRVAKRHAPVVYKYVYYPSSQIYYSPVRRMYYYPYAGGWRYGTVAPAGINLGNGVSITLGGPTPYIYHPTVIQQYPVVVLP